jgi:DNA-binding NarL/FixJ family response regulator
MADSLVASTAALFVAVDVDDETLAERLEKMLAEERVNIVIMEVASDPYPDIILTTRLSGAEEAPIIWLTDDPLNRSLRPPDSSLRAILPTNVASRELSAAIGAVAEGLVVMTPEMFQTVLEIEGGNGHDERNDGSLEPALTARESQVLALLADGGSNKHIARALGVSVHTAKFHVSALMSKLRARSRADVVAIGLRRGLIAL